MGNRQSSRTNQTELLRRSQKQRDRWKVLHEASQRHITQTQAAEQIGVPERWVRKLLVRMRKEGDGGILHRLRGREAGGLLHGQSQPVSDAACAATGGATGRAASRCASGNPPWLCPSANRTLVAGSRRHPLAVPAGQLRTLLRIAGGRGSLCNGANPSGRSCGTGRERSRRTRPAFCATSRRPTGSFRQRRTKQKDKNRNFLLCLDTGKTGVRAFLLMV